jgi:hypothetical protein
VQRQGSALPGLSGSVDAATATIGLPGFVVLAAAEYGGELVLLIETTESGTGCPESNGPTEAVNLLVEHPEFAVLDPGCVARGGVERGTPQHHGSTGRPAASEWRPLRRFLTRIRWGLRAEPDTVGAEGGGAMRVGYESSQRTTGCAAAERHFGSPFRGLMLA